VSDRGLVLIVDDDPSHLDTLRKLLEGDGYEVELRARGSDILDAITATEPDLVLLDTHLPDADPFDLLAEVHACPQGRDTPVIFLATKDDADGRLKGLKSGDDMLVRPYDEREVLARIERQVTVSKVRVALRESEAKFRSVMESAIDAIISGDAEGRIRSWNSAAAALFGHSEAEVLGQPIDLIIPERYRESHQNGIRRVSSGGPSRVIGSTVELAGIRKDGSEFPIELSLATWLLHDKRYYTGIIRDITERKQAEQKFRSVTDSAIDAIISADHKGEIISWNRAATRILGYEEEETIGERLELIIPQRFHEAHQKGMERFATTGEARAIGTTVELFARTKSGEELPIELSLSTWTVRDARYYTGIIRDIRERRRAEDALRASEQALRERSAELTSKNEVLEETLSQLKEAQNQLIIQEKMVSLGKLSAGMAHELNNPTSAIQRGATHLRRTFEQWLDLRLRVTELQLDEQQVARVTELDQAVNEEGRKPIDLDPLTRSDRETALESWLEEREVDASGELVPSLVDLGYDESDLAALAEGFSAAQFETVLNRLGCRYSVHRLVDEIGYGADRIVELVSALKAYTHMDRAPIKAVDVHKGLENTLIILRSKLKEGITVVREYADDLPPIPANVGEINQVWTSIIDNAIDAMNGQGRLALRTRSEGSWVVVEIEDDGHGIPEDIQSMVFDPFFTTKAPGTGTGLGLNISRNVVVQKHHGEMSVKSTPGSTCFIVRLPIESSGSE
jgi:PAS domain S-box-containing protein